MCRKKLQPAPFPIAQILGAFRQQVFGGVEGVAVDLRRGQPDAGDVGLIFLGLLGLLGAIGVLFGPLLGVLATTAAAWAWPLAWLATIADCRAFGGGFVGLDLFVLRHAFRFERFVAVAFGFNFRIDGSVLFAR